MAILVVDDDPSLRQVLERVLAFEGYDVETVPTGYDALERMQVPERGAAVIDLIVLDLGLPDIDGLDVARRLRADGQTLPILVLTARGDVGDRVAGLDAGADDYLPKPFDITELIARVRALLRRAGHTESTGNYALGDLTLDAARRQVTREGEEITLTKTEFALLQVLLAADGAVVERADRVDLEHMRMAHGGEAPGLPQGALPGLLVLGPDGHLEGHRSVQVPLAGQEDRPHAPLPELAERLEAGAERGEAHPRVGGDCACYAGGGLQRFKDGARMDGGPKGSYKRTGRVRWAPG
jgi:two-component system response regulator MprA